MVLLTINDVCESLSISRRTLERIRKVNFMKPTLFVGKSPRWEEETLRTWLTKTKNIKVQ